MQVKKRDGFEISGYIDYEQSLRECSLQVAEYTDWQAVFEGRKLLRPKPTDLSFYDWHKGVILHTDSANWQSVLYLKDLKFMNKLDLKIIPVTTRKSKFSINVTRSVFKSKLYESIVLYDHVLWLSKCSYIYLFSLLNNHMYQISITKKLIIWV